MTAQENTRSAGSMMALVPRQSSRDRWVLLTTFLLTFVVLYGMNWLIFHPGIVTVFYPDPPFDTPQPADVIVVLAEKPERA